MCALQYWKKDNQDHNPAWKSYLDLCNQDGTAPFLTLLKKQAKSPFNKNTILEVANEANTWLKNIDYNKF